MGRLGRTIAVALLLSVIGAGGATAAPGDRSATTTPEVPPGDSAPFTCPQSAALQPGCPPVTMTTRREVRKKAILVQVEVSSQALVQVYGQVSWQVRQPKARGGGNRGLIVGLTGGARRTVLPGTTATFRVPLPKAVKRRLGRLTKRQALRPKMTVVVTDLADRITSRVFRVRLPGYRPV